MSNKIYLNKSDSIASAIDKVISSPEEEIILYIPRDAKAAGSKKNIDLLKREVESAKKSVRIESVDEDILEMTLGAGFDATNPFLGRSKKTLSDIVVNSRNVKTSTKSKKQDENREDDLDDENRVDETYGDPSTKAKGRSSKGAKNSQIRKFAIAVLVTATITGGGTFMLVSLPRVSVALTLDKMEHGFIGSLRVSPSIEESYVEDDVVRVRGVVFSGEKNVTVRHKANGSDELGSKARGTITIYNNFGIDPQSLVKTTRFVTPDGNLYRLDNDVTVPGATKNADGTLTPATITASVTADQPGEKYNISPVDKFTIPGFQGSAKYTGFYGSSKSAMTGGALGQTKVPTDADLEEARKEASGLIANALKSEFFIDLPDGIKILEDSYSVHVIREEIDSTVDKNDEFGLTLYGELKLIGFDENELIDTLKGVFEEEGEVSLQIYDFTVDYGKVTLDLDNEVLESAISVESNWTRPFNSDEFIDSIAGMTENGIREKIFSTPGVQSGQVNLWPFWVRKVPSDPTKVSVDAS